MGRRVASVVALVVLVIVAGAGCGGQDAAPRPAPLASSPSPSPSASRAVDGPPVLPAAARGTSKRAAVAFVEHYVDVLNYAMASGDTRPLRHLASPSCTTCAVVKERIRTVYELGGSLTGAGWDARSPQYLGLQPRRRPVINVVMQIAPQTVVESAGQKPRHFAGGRVLYTFRLEALPSGWRVARLERAT